MPTVVVSGAIANKPFNGGATWTRLNWILGFRELGFNTFFVEQIGSQSCHDASGNVTALGDCANLSYFKHVTQQFGLADCSTLILENGEQTHGLGFDALLDIAASADLLVNITGHLTIKTLLDRFRRKVYVDLDPGFTQFWHAERNMGPRLNGHDFYFTVGENIGKRECSIPTGNIKWRPTRQPVVLKEWGVSQEGERDRFTTVASWRGPYGQVEFGGRTFGLKVHEFRKFFDLPQRASQQFEIALDIHPADEPDLNALRAHGWRVRDPKEVASDPCAFRRFVQSSGAEFSVAQGIYVETNSGWFSDRTVRYLASGKPALVQDTGFSRNYPTGVGLIRFRTLEEAVSGAEQIAGDYDAHCRQARALAEEFFDSDRVLGQMLEEVGVSL